MRRFRIPALMLTSAILLSGLVLAGCSGGGGTTPTTPTTPSDGKPTVMLFTQPG